MVPTGKRALGDQAEDLAFRYLKQRGLTPVRRNFACRLGELDLIMRDDHCLIVIEVRYRNHRSLVPSELTVDRRKQAKIIRSTAMFLSWNEQYAALPLRFDVVAIDTNPRGEITVKWISDAFRPTNSRL